MSDGGKSSRPPAPPQLPQQQKSGQGSNPTIVPGVPQDPVRDPMRGVRHERQAATDQIQRSLKAWRSASGSASTGGAASKVPKGGGSPLATAIRSRMEPQLGADLSKVRVHTGGDSAEAATGMGAKAFTVGSDVHFNSGEFQPGTKDGDKLLAHELTHVVQGEKSGVQRKAEDAHGDEGGEAKEGKAGADEVSDPNEPAEKEADSVGEKVADKLHGGDEKGKDGKKGDPQKDKDKKQGAKDGRERDAKGDEAAAGEEKDAGAGEKGGSKDGAAGEKGEAKEKAPEIGAKLYESAVVGKIYRGTAVTPHADPRVEIVSGNYMLKKDFQNKAFTRDSCYGKSYNSAVMDWKNRMLTTSVRSGGLRHPTDPNKFKYKDQYYENKGTTIASIGHEKPPVVNHWNDTGRKTTQDVRKAFFNGDGSPEANLIIQPLSLNSSDGASSGDNYNYQVTKEFRGP